MKARTAFLAKGDLVYILCTARSATSKELRPAVDLLESWGLRVELGTTIDLVHHQQGGTTAQRAADFTTALHDPDVKAIWIARGGYGTVHIMEQVDLSGLGGDSAFAKAQHAPKLLIGYSDATLLHAIFNNTGFPSLHSFMPLELKHKTQVSIDSLRNALFEREITLTIPNDQELPEMNLVGKVYGGNLSILYSLLGSADFPDLDGGILFIEEIDEYLYHVERMMYSLKRAGALQGLKAIVVGGMTDLRDHEIPHGLNYQQIIENATTGYDYPIIYNFPAGHIENHHSIILGAQMQIKITPQKIVISQ
ncbi:MAG: LD-carboxypeptidase [Nonlabens sp.]